MWNTWYADGKVSLQHFPQLIGQENLCVALTGEGVSEVGIVKDKYIVKVKYYNPAGIKAKNPEQLAALSILSDASIPLKVISGAAGSGKTLLATAHAVQRLEKGSISKIVLAKNMTPVGREIGFLKGDMNEKVMPWLGPFQDSLIHCGIPPYKFEHMIDEGLIEVTPITFIQGRSISDAIIIIDEVQNIELNIIKQIITRAAANTEVILLGDPTQVFEKHIKDNVLGILAQRSSSSPLVGHVELIQSVRSPLSQWAVDNL